jgi:hypothetical protein
MLRGAFYTDLADKEPGGAIERKHHAPIRRPLALSAKIIEPASREQNSQALLQLRTSKVLSSMCRDQAPQDFLVRQVDSGKINSCDL